MDFKLCVYVEGSSMDAVRVCAAVISLQPLKQGCPKCVTPIALSFSLSLHPRISRRGNRPEEGSKEKERERDLSFVPADVHLVTAPRHCFLNLVHSGQQLIIYMH